LILCVGGRLTEGADPLGGASKHPHTSPEGQKETLRWLAPSIIGGMITRQPSTAT
jgi:hypothetical protein